jgi:hypothetical protein
MNDIDKPLACLLAQSIAALCVRNTFLEDLHSGTTPSSKSGDYSDVRVVTPFGEIPWRNLSRISDAEMKRLMKEIVDKIYTFLCRQEDPPFLEAFLRLGSMYAASWDEPRTQEEFVLPAKGAWRKPRKGGKR